MQIHSCTTLALAACAGLLTGCSGEAPDEPARFFHDAQRAFEEGRPLALLDMVPERYNRGWSDLVHRFAQRMDAEVWEEEFRLVGKLGRVIDERRELLFGHPIVALAIGADREKADAQLEAFVAMLDGLAESEAATLAGLGRLDLRAFLRETLSPLLATLKPEEVRLLLLPILHPFDLGWIAQDFTTTTVLFPERTTVEIHRANGKLQRFDMIRVDGRWMLEAVAADWDRGLKEARAWIETFTLTPEKKAEILRSIRFVDEVLDRLLAAEDAEDPIAVLVTAIVEIADAFAFGGPTRAGMEVRPLRSR